MKLKKIILENIRSYINQEIEFNNGITLLSGDIGSGKSTVLQALDFALFGIQKSLVSGQALLRNGSTKGSVELHFEIENLPIVIKRNLKKSKDSVVQDSGYIIKNGTKLDATAVELKQNILELLNYPQELLTKSKSIIYRYTVYTPQEEMKSILLGDKESRIETLRKVFDIDKYKRIQENSKILITYFKSENKARTIQIQDLPEKESQYLELIKKELQISEEITTIPLQESLKDLDIIKLQIKSLESKREQIVDKKNKLKLIDLEINHKTKYISNYTEEINQLNKKINELELEISKILPNNIHKLDEIKSKIIISDQELRSVLTKLVESKSKIRSSEEIQDKIQKLDICPTCKQKVTQEYITNVITTENNLILALKIKITKLESEYSTKESEISSLKQELEIIQEHENQLKQLKLKRELLDEKKNKLNFLTTQISQLTQEKQVKELEKQTLELELKTFSNLDSEYIKTKELLEHSQSKHNKLEIQKSNLEQNLEYTKKEIQKLNLEIIKKKTIKQDLDYWSQMQFWLDNHFINLMLAIEKKIMSQVHHDFNSLFQKWFSLIIDSELISATLDQEFTPLIEQNSHDIEYKFLSGGEKTALALAYRLALNQTINKLKSYIKTKDLIILDEPTDGFSTEQLDKLRNVFRELDINQIIIVSHESKIESFADKIIRLEKQNHITRIIN